MILQLCLDSKNDWWKLLDVISKLVLVVGGWI